MTYFSDPRGKNMTSRHFSQTPPDKANDLFEKLLATSDTAVKTRERLFLDLKEELDLLATLQEQHLFPILEAHGMLDLLQQATKDNEKTSLLLEEVERMPKNGDDFLKKIGELRKTFQRHIRDDRKQLLPAVLKVLTDEEAQAVVEQVKDDVVTFEETKLSETSQPSNKRETLPLMSEGVAEVMRSGTERAQTLARGVQDISHECLQMSQKRLQTNIDGFGKLAQCRSLQDLAQAQVSLLRDNVEQAFSNIFRIADLSTQLAERTTWRAVRQTEKTAQHSRDFA
jgi:hypothetical protein